MRVKKSGLCAGLMVFSLAMLLCGCEELFHDASFSPDGRYVVFNVSPTEDENPDISGLWVLDVEDPELKPYKIYSPQTTGILHVFWARENIVLFESEGCPDPPQDDSVVPPESIPKRKIRVGFLDAGQVELKKNLEPKTVLEKAYPCWVRVLEDQQDPDEEHPAQADSAAGEYTWEDNESFDFMFVSYSPKKDILIFNSGLNDIPAPDGFVVMDAKTGKLTRILPGRNVYFPILSPDGEMLAFYEYKSDNIYDFDLDNWDKSFSLKALDLETLKETEIEKRPGLWVATAWSLNHEFLVYPAALDLPYHIKCPRSFAESASEEMRREIMELATRDIGPCEFFAGPAGTNAVDDADHVFKSGSEKHYYVYKFFPSSGNAAPLFHESGLFSLNPFNSEILVHYVPEVRDMGRERDNEDYIMDSKGNFIRNFDNKKFWEFEAASPLGFAFDVWDDEIFEGDGDRGYLLLNTVSGEIKEINIPGAEGSQ